eukprot:m.111227 g.111227  ORF g.111227 m.111227 type:complete len:514 (+) comp28107_c1_seq1:39-1580(+)
MASLSMASTACVVFWVAIGSSHSVIATHAIGECTSSFDGCHLNGDCVNGKCQCDPWWSGAADCSVVAFEPQEKNVGYYNTSAASWGGLPIEVDGTWHLFHAQMMNHCGLGTWTSNSVVARSTSQAVEGPYVFQEEVLSNFAHNPTIRKVPGGYVIWYIGGWPMEAKKCGGDEQDKWKQPSAACSNATVDDHKILREGGDFADVELAKNATVQDCIAACCSNEKCAAFSFNVAANNASVAPGCSTSKGNACCKLKSGPGKIVTNGCAGCTSGLVRNTPAPSQCTGAPGWPRSCGQDMPGPNGDTCGPKGNNGCGNSMAFATSITGPWEHQSINITDQWSSPRLYCAHTNPSPFFLPNGTIVMAVNGGFCDEELETIGLVYADSWNGTWKMWSTDTILHNPDGSPHKCEDPHLWIDERGWHLLTHNQQGPQGESSYGYSLDGFTWTLSPTTPYGCVVNFTDGTSAVADGCGNRPQFVHSGPNGEPQWITNGAEGAKPWRDDGLSFTLFRKLKQAN